MADAFLSSTPAPPAYTDKEAKYPELARQNQYGELTVLAGETRGRWHQRALTTVRRSSRRRRRQLHHCCGKHPPLRVIDDGVASLHSVPLLDHPGMGSMPGPGPEPPLGDLLQIAMHWRARRLAASHCGTFRRRRGNVANTSKPETQL